MRVKMCSIHVTDPAAAHAVYTEKFGFDTLMAIPEANLFIVQDASIPGGPGLLLEPSDNPIGEDYRSRVYEAGMPAIVFGVQDVAAEAERLAAAGLRVLGEPVVDPSGTYVDVDDSCGNLIRLHQD